MLNVLTIKVHAVKSRKLITKTWILSLS